MLDFELSSQVLLTASMVFLSVTIFACLVRVIIGPKLTDRIVATNMINIKVMLLILLLGTLLKESSFVDTALIYALLSFFAVIVFTRFVNFFKSGKNAPKMEGGK